MPFSVDCVKFVGDLILSKSTTNSIALWKPELSMPASESDHETPMKCNDKFVHLCDFDCHECDVWFVRFATNIDCKMLVIGNRLGDLRLFHIDTRRYYTFVNFNASSVVRDVSFSPDGTSLFVVCDDSTVWRWIIENENDVITEKDDGYHNKNIII